MKFRLGAAVLFLIYAASAHAQSVNVGNLPLAPGVADGDFLLKYDSTQVSGQRTQKYPIGSLAAYIASKIPVGPAGPMGPVTRFYAGSATALPVGASPTVNVTGTPPSQYISLGIPQGAVGPQGIQGVQGPIGLTGPSGPQGLQGAGNVSTSGLYTAGDFLLSGNAAGSLIVDGGKPGTAATANIGTGANQVAPGATTCSTTGVTDCSGAKVTATGGNTPVTEAVRSALRLSVLDFGAVCDGQSHPLSAQFATLAAAQVKYPFATSLTNEVDWAAFQAAANLGQAIYIPSGICKPNASIAVVNGTQFIGAGRPQQFTYAPTTGTTIDFVGAPAGADGFVATGGSTLQMVNFADFQVERAPGHAFNFSVAQGTFDRVTTAYNGADGFHLPNSYLVRISNSLAEFNAGNGLTATATGQYTTLQILNSEASHNTGDGWQTTKFNSTSFVSTGADANGGWGYDAINSNVAFVATDSESNAKSGYRLYGSYAQFLTATAAANNTSGTTQEANFVRGENGSNITLNGSGDLASTTPYSIVAVTSSTIAGLQNKYVSASYADANSVIAQMPGNVMFQATGSINFGQGSNGYALYGDAGNTIVNGPSGSTLGFRINNTAIGTATASGWSFLQPITMAASTSIGFANGANKYSLYGDGSNTLLNTPAGGSISFRNGGIETGYAVAGAWVFKQPVKLPSYTVATLPICNAGAQDQIAVATDTTSPTYRGALTGGGTVRTLAYCDGSSWTAH